jgi:hypothetical protein
MANGRRSQCFTTLSTLVIGFSLVSASIAQQAPIAQNVPLPKVEGPIPVTSTSVIWGHSWNVDLTKVGYKEEEFFVSGHANVYDHSPDKKVEIRTSNVPYTTRLLVRAPIDPKRFSGNVIVEIINMSRGWDLDVMWQMEHEYILRNGDAYVGVTSKPNAVKALKQFDSVRYASLSWKNPLSLDNPQNCTKLSSLLPNDSSRETENGLFWDIFSQVGALLKSEAPGRPLNKLAVKYIYAVGYSQSGMFLATYIDAIQPLALTHNKQIYDGYLVGAGPGTTPINQCEPRANPREDSTPISPRSVPVMKVMTNTDFLWSYKARRPDGDSPDDRYRLYEIAGSSHGYVYPGSFEPSVDDIKRAGFDNRYSYKCAPPRLGNDFPDHYFFAAALKNLDLWVRKDIPPPHGTPIDVVNATEERQDPVVGTLDVTAKLDQYGNAVGGVRSPYLDVPTATYYPDGINKTDQAECGMSKAPFDHAMLANLYPTHQDYVEKVDNDVDRLIKERWLLKEDGDAIKAAAASADVP